VCKIFVVDCFSTDETGEIAKSLGAEVVQHAWLGNQAEQFNWALAKLPIKTKWVLRLDADEYLTSELIAEIQQKLPTLAEDVTGVSFPRHHIFLGREMKHGVGRTVLLRLFQYGRATCEQRQMDEHIQLLEGKCVECDNLFFDHNLLNLGWWTQKHNGYALREALELLDIELGIRGISGKILQTEGLGDRVAANREKKMRYAKLPLFWRATFYFVLRYFVKGGFLDGKEGFLWHFLQGWWYRTLVDAKIVEIKKAATRRGGVTAENIVLVLKEEYTINV
jgi:glycosyltransferase involved in cell wall biosynthesis